jgi:hypothetical protein
MRLLLVLLGAGHLSFREQGARYFSSYNENGFREQGEKGEQVELQI